MMTAIRAWIRRRAAHESDAGFTLVELLAAMAVFSMLMAMISSAMLGGMNSVGHLAKKSDQQATWSQTSETISRLLRYAANPELSKSSIVWASPTSLRFYSASGISGSNDRPNLVDIRFNTTTKLVTLVVYPLSLNPDLDASSGTADAWKYPTWETQALTATGVPAAIAPYIRTVMKSDTATSPISLSVRVRCAKPPCPTRPANGDITPASEGAPPINASEYYDSVVVTIGDPTDTANRLTQQVRLPNLHPLS